MDFQLFIPIEKIDVAQRLVFGTIAEEIPDHADEIMDYDSAKPEFEAWSAEIAKASNGRSVGNLRAMHGSVAAGRLDQIHFDDDARRIATVAKVVDDAEWQKVLEGVYTGFSMGGRYVNRWPDPKNPALTRYTPRPLEVSLVDHPCIPSATFEVVKADGSVELRKFKPAPDDDGGSASAEPAAQANIAGLIDLIRSLIAQAAATPDDPDAGDDETRDDDTSDDDDETLDKRVEVRFAKLIAPQFSVMTEKMETLSRRLEHLEAQPMPGGPVTKFVTLTKQQDAGGAQVSNHDPLASFQTHLDQLAPGERAHLLTKLALRNPISGR